MTAPDRSVRSLRLRAGSEEEIGRVLPRLEDALRCASLPDTGARVLLVRKLALGCIASDANSQTLSRLIELRVTGAAAQWVRGGTSGAGNARFVSFASGLEARTQLAVRLARGEPCTEWYWPLAVPELRTAAGPAMLLRSIAEAIAQLPEARTALPVWIEAVVAAGGLARLLAAIDANTGEALLRQAGIALRSQAVDGNTVNPAPPGVLSSGGQSHTHGGPHARPDARVLPSWLQALLMATGVREAPPTPRAPLRANGTAQRQPNPRAIPMEEAAARTWLSAAARMSGPEAPVSSVAQSPAPIGMNTSPPPVPSRSLEGGSIDASAPTVHAGFLDAEAAEPEQGDPSPGLSSAALTLGTPNLEPTACAGLLFLLPVLARLGVDSWSMQAEPHGERFAHRVLMHALRCVDVAPDDPAWTLIPIELRAGEPLAVPPPSSWRDPLLAAPHARRADGGIGDALRLARSADAQAAVWLRAARRWLRRAAGIGLATLVLRPGFISLTSTHVDIHFRIDDTDMRIRRAALDLDPGWLPWFGRVVSFHYSERQG